MLKNKDFIVFSDDWGRHPFSCQHIMEHFLKADNRILWVNTIGLRTPALTLYDIKRSVQKIGSWLKPRKQEEAIALPEGLRIISPLMIPYNTVQGIRNFNKNSVIKATRAASAELGLKNPILLATLPNAADYAGHLGESMVIYYCVDDFTVWPGMNQPELVSSLEADLLAKSDLTIAVSNYLVSTRNNGKAPTCLLTHGVDFDLFKQAAVPAKISAGQPTIGFYGLIDSHMDVALMDSLLSLKPDWSFVFYGTRRIDLGALEQHANFSWNPAVPYRQLPDHVSGFDALIIPYVVNDHTQSASPLKLREYLATGKPVVSTPMQEVFRFRDYISIAATAHGFAMALEKLLANPPSAENQWEALAGERWSDKAGLMSGWIANVLEQKQTQGTRYEQ